MILIILYLLLLWGIARDFKKTVILFAPFKLLILNWCFFPETTMSFEGFVSLTFIVYYLFHKGSIDYTSEKFPLTIAFALFGISESIAMCYEQILWKTTPLHLCCTYGFVFLLFKVIETEEDLQLLFKAMTVYAALLFGNAIIEIITSQVYNPLGELIQSYCSEDLFFASDETIYTRGIRIRSYLPHSIGFGNVCSMMMYLFLSLYVFYKSKKTYLLLIVLSIVGIYLSNSRTPLPPTLLFLVPIFFSSLLSTGKGKLILIVLFVALYFGSDYIFGMIDTMLHDSNNEMGGSTMEMRFEQLGACFLIIGDHTLLGLGSSFNIHQFNDVLQGAESVWFNLICRQGIVGCICYIYVFIKIIHCSRKNPNFKFIVFLCIGYLLAQSATYNAGLDDYICYLLFLIFYKSGQLNLLDPSRYEKSNS